ncbi:MAG TPA: hypothetical protein VN829_06385 [Dongiaceae bacterium]|nr:hypothetical protein [Dongiaceae bacterium]
MGAKTRNRACPAAGREITAFECGSGRHTTYACPEECPFNPFSVANYDDFRRIEWAAEKKLFEWMLATVPDRAQFNQGLERVIGRGPNPRYFHYMAWHSVFQLGPDGDSCVGKWAKAGFPGLSADERVFLRGRNQIRPAMIEVHRVLDGKRVEAVDLLDAERRPILIVDHSLAMQAIRFGVCGVYLVPLPNYMRMFGTCTWLPDLFPLEPEGFIREVIGHLGGSTDEAGMRGFLTQHFQRVEEALTAATLARREAIFEQLDAQYGKAASRTEDPPYDKTLVPPALLKDLPKLVFTASQVPVSTEPASPGTRAADFERQRDREFLDAPIPALEGKTPRQAAADPAFREPLRRLMKSRISATDQRNLETGRNDDVNWLVRELGLTEILFDPPPLRPRLGPGSERLGA